MGLKKNNPGCGCCGGETCGGCSGTIPSTVSATFASIANGTGCTGCTYLNATFVLDWLSDCIWQYDESDWCGAGSSLQITAARVLIIATSEYFWRITCQVYDGVTTSIATFEGAATTLPALVDCSVNETLSRVSVTNDGDVCDFSSSTCDIN